MSDSDFRSKQKNKIFLIREHKQMLEAYALADKSAKDVSNFADYIVKTTLKNSVIKKLLSAIVKDTLAWNKLHFPVPYLDNKMKGYLSGALYSLYPQQNVKYLDKAFSSKDKAKAKSFDVWLNKLGTTDYSGTDVDYLEDEIPKIQNIALMCHAENDD